MTIQIVDNRTIQIVDNDLLIIYQRHYAWFPTKIHGKWIWRKHFGAKYYYYFDKSTTSIKTDIYYLTEEEYLMCVLNGEIKGD